MTDTTSTADSGEDLEVLRRENEALRQQLDAQQPGGSKQSSGPLWRRIVAGILAALAIVAVLLAVDAIWLKTILTDTEAFVSTLEPLPQEEAVATAVSVRIADGIVELAGVEAYVAETLPEPIGFLAAPLTEGISEFTTKAAHEVVTSDGFTTLWSGALRVTHTAVGAVLTGDDRLLVAEGGVVAIDLDESAAAVVERLEAAGVSLPDVGDQIELGQIVILESDQLAAAQSAAQLINTAGWVVPIIALLLMAAAIWAALDRRRMTAILGFGTAIVLLLSLVALRVGRAAVLNGIEEDISREAGAAVWDVVLERLVQGTWALLVLALLVGFVAWMVGPSPKAVGLRSSATRTIDGWRRPAETDPSGFMAFMAEWKRSIQVIIVVLGLLFVLFGPRPSGWLVLLTTAVVLLLVVVVEVLGGPATSPTAISAPGTDDSLADSPEEETAQSSPSSSP
jgi:hypothetical protein